ncbi:transcriptional regulator with XRE-family HTH domain [Saccharothrix coeruleofusca]|uniref:helix-turn-helix domain-containing protein n=1 Tax=Saccharothrix coeruleofusca TaxID=33919 RepID=UPI001AEA4458|nr:helix-turn-helix domain-containing protein [Saccharothrix coeruleofusca]MBP2335581.1 transcriptional regulator with XRE-family HTH domain [Saccharothrix coeruleofusca]
MNDLGAALRAWRDRLPPSAVGLAHSSPRRAPGLRREELAVLAGISIEYVVRIEQGRAATPSAQVCLALARALQLSDEEQAHLMRLAGHVADPARVPRLIPGSVHRIMDQLVGHPLSVYDATWQLLHWNPLFAATFGDPSALSADGRNMLLCQFEGGPSRVRVTRAERSAYEESLVADLRATTSRYPDDPELTALVARLTRSARFRELWALGTVAAHQSGHKVVEHPEVGAVALDSDTLTTQDSNLRVVVYTPRPGTDARSKLDLLAAIGTQRLAPLAADGDSGGPAHV